MYEITKLKVIVLMKGGKRHIPGTTSIVSCITCSSVKSGWNSRVYWRSNNTAVPISRLNCRSRVLVGTIRIFTESRVLSLILSKFCNSIIICTNVTIISFYQCLLLQIFWAKSFIEFFFFLFSLLLHSLEFQLQFGLCSSDNATTFAYMS